MSKLNTNPLDLLAFFDGRMDRFIEQSKLFDDTFGARAFSALVIDPDNDFPLKDYQTQNPERYIKYIDLSECAEGDYERIRKMLEQHVADGEFAFDGLILDNIDRIQAGADTQDLRLMVWQTLKRDDSELGGYRLSPYGPDMPFDKTSIACRCAELPEYINGKSLLSIFIKF